MASDKRSSMHYGRTWVPGPLHPFDPEDFDLLPRREAEQFARDWIATIPERITLLESCVQGTPGFEGWRANRSRESLIPLPRWVAKSLVMIPPSPEDIEADLSSRTGLSEAGRVALRAALEGMWSFDEEGFGRALVIDVATYIGECIREALPKLTWKRQSREKGLESYNSPCLLSPSGRECYEPFCGPSGIIQAEARFGPREVGFVTYIFDDSVKWIRRLRDMREGS